MQMFEPQGLKAEYFISKNLAGFVPQGHSSLSSEAVYELLK